MRSFFLLFWYINYERQRDIYGAVMKTFSSNLIIDLSGMDFIAFSLVVMEQEDRGININSVTGNMSPEMTNAFMERYKYHRNRLNIK
jgi:hypothetical protein